MHQHRAPQNRSFAVVAPLVPHLRMNGGKLDGQPVTAVEALNSNGSDPLPAQPANRQDGHAAWLS